MAPEPLKLTPLDAADNRLTPMIGLARPHDTIYWRELLLLTAVTFLFLGITIFVVWKMPTQVPLITTISTLMGGFAGSLLTKLKS